VVVEAQIPAGLRRVTIECRERLGGGAWEPRAVVRTDGAGGKMSVRLERSRALELLRIRADATDPLPLAFYNGTNAFFDSESSGSGPPRAGVLDLAGPGAVNPNANAGQPASREVVESDIWRIRGQTLYFFNQMRGLQVIDLSDPDAARVTGQLALPAAGEDLYVLGDSHVVLLAQNQCSSSGSAVLVVSTDSGQPTIMARLALNGYILESRLVGTALYVATQTYRQQAGTNLWEWGTQVSSFDLADPNAPVARDTLWYSGYGNVVSANDTLLFVVTQDPSDWWRSVVRAIDITAPDGTMAAYQSVNPSGRVPDKFKLRWQNGVLTTISEDWRTVTGRRVTTKVETFRLPDPRSMGPVGVVKLGELEVGQGEQLHATRFDGDRVYIVTFFRIDPLWVVDLSDASKPHIAGSVDVPGWSTYIEPLGSRLVSIGIESNRVAVSLFDVANPAAPALLSRVRLGNHYSYSEATWDEKAFAVLPDDGLILVPFSGDTTTNGYASSVQLVDLLENSVVARGVIEQQFQPRRATLYHERVLSLAASELLSVDASDRDHPLVRGRTPLAWPVDRVFLHGQFVVELSESGMQPFWVGSPATPVLRVADAGVPDIVLGELELAGQSIIGASKRGNYLYLLQGENNFFWPIWAVAAEAAAGGSEPVLPEQKVTLTVVNLAALPKLEVVGTVESSAEGAGGPFTAVWPTPNLLVFAGGSSFRWGWPCFNCIVPLGGDVAVPMVGEVMVAPMAIRFWPPFFGGSGGVVLAFDVSAPQTPVLASALNLNQNDRWNFSSPFAVDGLVYLSHQTSESIVVEDALVFPYPVRFVNRSFLDVIDYTDAKEPLVRKPVSVPGSLQGVSHQGAVVYTVGNRFTTNVTDWTEHLSASAYDGVSAHLIDSFPLPSVWPRALHLSEQNIYLSRAENTGSSQKSTLETWQLSDAGRLVRVGAFMLNKPLSALATFGNHGELLAGQETDNGVALFDATSPAALREAGRSSGGCFWFDLTRGDGTLARGLWLPLGSYGVSQVPVQ